MLYICILMKKYTILIILSLFCVNLFAQTHSTVDITDEVYLVLQTAEEKGLCQNLSNLKPYTEKYILDSLYEIKASLEKKNLSPVDKVELNTIDSFINKYQHKNGFDFNRLSYRIESNNSDFPASFEFSDSIDGFISTGFYDNPLENSQGYELYNNFNFTGDFGKNVSYKLTAFFEVMRMPLYPLGTYNIGSWWYDYLMDSNGLPIFDSSTLAVKIPSTVRSISKYKNFFVLPFSYKKHWDGSSYAIGSIDAEGLSGWPFTNSIGFGVYGEIHGSFLNNRVEVGIGRYNREWAAMDDGSSLVLNSNAHPFLGFDVKLQLFKSLSFSMLTGVLEFPNQQYINENAWYITDGKGNIVYPTQIDSYFYQNAFSIGMLDLDLKYLHLDFGSAVVWPKRFEIGYIFSFLNSVVYQNSLGDYDNLSLFGDLKLKYPGVGSVWLSVYLDEINSFTSRIFEATRCMFALQAGTKVNIPFIPMGVLSFRYTKVEPFCYTHQALKYQPWYATYLNESYTNNGECLGYYLPPNSDEFFVRSDFKPTSAFSVGLQYQFVRHGTDWGEGQVPGSSLYSELNPDTTARKLMKKNFLHDGVYEWMNIISIDLSYDLKSCGIPIMLTSTVGYMHNWFTYADYGLPYTNICTSDYFESRGFVVSIGFKAFAY